MAARTFQSQGVCFSPVALAASATVKHSFDLFPPAQTTLNETNENLPKCKDLLVKITENDKNSNTFIFLVAFGYLSDFIIGMIILLSISKRGCRG